VRVLGDHPINQFDTQVGMAAKRVGIIALVALAKASEVERIVAAIGQDIIGNQVIVGNQVTVLGMISKITRILNQGTSVVNEGVVNRNRAILAIARERILLEPFQTMGIDAGGIVRGG
jgi:hypothetical protein